MTEDTKLLEEVQGKLDYVNQCICFLTNKIEEHKKILRKKKEVVRSLFQEKKRRLNEIKLKTGRLKELDVKKKTVDRHCHQLQNAIIGAQYDEDITLDQIEQIKVNLEKKDRDRSNLQESRHNNRLQKFGAWVPELTRKIEAAFNGRKFWRKPFGPLGAFISLKDPKWALAVEMCLDNMLHSYVTDNHEDEKILAKMMKETIQERRPKIVVGRYDETLYDVQSHQFNTILDVVDVKETIVTNFLIDKVDIQNVLLIENQEEARELMSRNPPRNFSLAYTASGDKVFLYPSFIYCYNIIQRPRFLLENIDELIKDIDDEIESLRNEQKKYETELSVVRRAVNENKKNLDTNNETQKETQKEIQILQNEIAELKNISDDLVGLSVLEQEVKQYEGIINELERRTYAVVTSKYEPLKEVFKKVQQRTLQISPQNT